METQSCKKCGQLYPATNKFFEMMQGCLRHICRPCREAQKKVKRDGRRLLQAWFNAEQLDLFLTCNQCGQVYPRTDEFFARRENGNFRFDCRRCHAQRERERRREKPDAIREMKQRRYLANRQYYIAKAAEWGRKNPDKIRAYRNISLARRRALRLNNTAGPHHTVKDIRLKYKQQNGCCYWCQKELNGHYEVDHYIPLSRGGSNAADNIVLTCRACNRRKHNKMPEEFLQYLARNNLF